MRLIWVLALLPGLAVAQEWQRLDGDQIKAALTGRVLDYGDSITQVFNATGSTVYRIGTADKDEVWGLWKVEGDRYCSIWRASMYWSCYRLHLGPIGFRFQDTDNPDLETLGRYMDEP